MPPRLGGGADGLARLPERNARPPSQTNVRILTGVPLHDELDGDMESVPGAVATGLPESAGSSLLPYPVATAPGTDLINMSIEVERWTEPTSPDPRELKTRLLERGEPLRELVGCSQTSQDCHDYRDDQRNNKRRKIEREHDNFLLM